MLHPAKTQAALELMENCRALLRGKEPDVQAAVLAELVSIFLVGHPPEYREEALARHVETVRKYIEINAAALAR